jgi:hypothetical protein
LGQVFAHMRSTSGEHRSHSDYEPESTNHSHQPNEEETVR